MFASAAKTDDDDDDDDYDEEEEESSSAKENNVFHTEVRTLYDPNNSGVFGFQSSEEFKEKVLETRDVWVVQFIAPGCQPCKDCLLYTSPSPRDTEVSRMPSSA